ncbi:MAG TPA: hypothetical protein VF761_07725 [Gemmatimonadaceae bacterium]
MRHPLWPTLSAAALALAAACADSPTAPRALGVGPALDRRAGGGGLSISQTASGFDETVTDYDWTFEKKVEDVLAGVHMLPEGSKTETTIIPNDVKWIVYDLTATRDQGTTTSATGVRGQVCVANPGPAATQGLAITQIVQSRSGGAPFQTVASRAIDVSAKPTLAGGQSYCYPYELPFTPTSGAEYRTLPRVTIANGDVGAAAPLGFTIPAHVQTTRDASARIDESLISACRNIWPGIMCTWGDHGVPELPFIVDKSTTLRITVDLHNFHVCGESLPFVNAATLTELGPPGAAPEVHTSSAALTVKTGECAPKPANPGCTLTQGYWKNHPWPVSPLFPPSTLDTWDTDHGWAYQGWNFFDTGMRWKTVLGIPPRGDAYYILAHQYIAAILNQQNGAYVPDEVRQVLVNAYGYFSAAPQVRATYDRNTLTTWATLLDRYNNGQLGVPHCG